MYFVCVLGTGERKEEEGVGRERGWEGGGVGRGRGWEGRGDGKGEGWEGGGRGNMCYIGSLSVSITNRDHAKLYDSLL